MATYPFLSDQWVQEARHIYERAQDQGPLVDGARLNPARVNLIVNGAPFAGEPVQAHVDTSEGRLELGAGHLDKPDVTVSMAYDTARALFVAGDMQAVMQAFLGGRIRVDGDLSKLLDPRSGLWPAALGPVPVPPLPEAGASAATHTATAGPEMRLDLPRARAQDIARQLQEITE